MYNCLLEISSKPTPKGTKYWVPKANNKPVEGTIFDTIEAALKAYKAYAREAGFENDKGERSTKRLQSHAEIDMIQSNRSPRYCRTCMTYGFHDSSNCPTKKKWLSGDDSPNYPTKNKGLADEPMYDDDYVP
uniref:FAR1 DNA binding domain, zinc finger, SWIM-type, MULE transposase domain, FHY3/FAR1 family n=1 Tax=Tanacetum cinerariifolium TaxID=118510 RepID=A0A699KVR0_TANCI|nr:FAR1 DNA binding domain, zinc finger, SWIM-type, MULE transposase domain, FHY3/FAR1 family [Tanacetum cinerariifolium]